MKKTVLITGSAVRVGRALALRLAGLGWDIAIHHRDSAKEADKLAGEIAKMKRKAYPVRADLGDPSAVAKIIPSLSRQGVKLDALVNCASVFEKDNLASLAPASWEKHMHVNLFAPLLLMRDFAAQYKGREGNIVNVTDGVKGWSIAPEFLSYSLSKLSLAAAGEFLALELAPRIRVNTIAPGPMLEGKQDKKDTYAKLRRAIPLSRTSTPEEFCDAICYLFNAPSVTGQTLWLSGGLQLT